MLACKGGNPVRTKPFPGYNVIGQEEKDAVAGVLDSGVLSRFLGCYHEDFLGGPQVRSLEKEWAEFFNVKHAISVNSATSGLYAAVGAVGIEPGDEVIVSPYSMCASATAPLVYGGIPVFADIEDDCFCLSAESIERCITPRTKAIIVVDIFGQPYDAEAINALARKHGLKIIEDVAQAPLATYGEHYAGTLGDVGVFSLNYHKHIHCGEGGIIVTNDDAIAERLQLIRNHAEAVVQAKGVQDISNMVGFNYRMTEMEAAVARCQLQKLRPLVEKRLTNVAYIEKHLAEFDFLTLPKIRDNATHVYYQHPLKFNEEAAGIPRDAFVNAMQAELPVYERRETEGTKISSGYVRPLYMQPLFQQQTAYGTKGFPFSLAHENIEANYAAGSCPVTEKMHTKELILHEFMIPSMQQSDIDDVLEAFHKVWKHRDDLI